MNNEILHILSENARMPLEEIAARVNLTPAAAAAAIEDLERSGVIKGYTAILDDAVFPERAVKAIIQVQTRPEREDGFNRISQRISRFDEVESVFLVSGAYDLQIVVTGKTLQDVAFFVSSKLSPIEGVMSTATHFILKKFKESGVLMTEEDEHERLPIVP